MTRRKFTAAEQRTIDHLVEQRVCRARRRWQAEHDAELARARAACQQTMDGMAEHIAQLRGERNELLNAVWSLMEERNRLRFVRRWLHWFKSRGLTDSLRAE